ncbi:hypothetical protein HWV62_42438 [Athelia sp. TMB]|nr:hypothetical protein HWV62_42438 [Athelia sp. TMB]
MQDTGDMQLEGGEDDAVVARMARQLSDTVYARMCQKFWPECDSAPEPVRESMKDIVWRKAWKTIHSQLNDIRDIEGQLEETFKVVALSGMSHAEHDSLASPSSMRAEAHHDPETDINPRAHWHTSSESIYDQRLSVLSLALQRYSINSAAARSNHLQDHRLPSLQIEAMALPTSPAEANYSLAALPQQSPQQLPDSQPLAGPSAPSSRPLPQIPPPPYSDTLLFGFNEERQNIRRFWDLEGEEPQPQPGNHHGN